MPDISTPEPSNARQGFFEEPDSRALLDELPEHLQASMTFGYYTGWRIPSEAFTRQWSHVDLHVGVVRLEPGETKNRQGRTFPFATFPTLRLLLEEHRARVTGLEQKLGRIIPWVFPNPDGQRIKGFRRSWLSALQRAAVVQHENGMSEVARPQLLGRIPHDLRRTAVRNLVRAGVPEKVAMALTGHKTRSVSPAPPSTKRFNNLAVSADKWPSSHPAIGWSAWTSLLASPLRSRTCPGASNQERRGGA